MILLLINGVSLENARAFCLQRGITPGEVEAVLKQARARITVAADYAREEQVGRAVMRIENLYARSLAEHDNKTALQAQKELNRLLSLYSGAGKAAGALSEADDPSRLRGQLELIAQHLLPLGLADEDYPIEEHARIAAELIRNRPPRNRPRPRIGPRPGSDQATSAASGSQPVPGPSVPQQEGPIAGG